jgi:hypothetical protein
MWSWETVYWCFETWNDDGVAARIHDTPRAVVQEMSVSARDTGLAIGWSMSSRVPGRPSLPLRRVLGDSRVAFEQEVTAALLATDTSGQFTEPAALEVLRPSRGRAGRSRSTGEHHAAGDPCRLAR